jgi:hypothetical protein
MTGWFIPFFFFTLAWLSMLGVVWLFCWAAAKADRRDRAVPDSALEPRAERSARKAAT